MTPASRAIGRRFAAAAFLLSVVLQWPAAEAADPGRPVVYEGTVAVAVEDDFVHGRATRRYFLDEQNLGQRLELRVTEAQGRALRTGARIRVRGVAAGGTLAADTTGDGVTVLADAVAAAPVTARKAVVMLVDITDSTSTTSRVSADCDGSVAKSAGIMFGNATITQHVDGCYKDSSFGAVGFGGSVYPGSTTDVVHVSVTEAATTSGTCNYSAWGSAADKAAAAAGITLANYQHRVYVLPANVGCGWAGLAYVGCGNSCQAWIKAYSGQVCGYNDAYAHELGHNLGMWHASTDTNNDGTLDCEYCDTSDFMGYAMANLRTQNGPHKVQMGWASGSRVVDGSQGGTYTVSSLALSGAAFPQVVKVRPTSGDPYYLSLRTASGYDAVMPSSATYLNRTTIHRWSSGNTRYITTLGDGETYSDPVTGVSFKQLGHTSDSATFQVTTTCVAQAPTATISPSSQGSGGSLPASRSYTLTVTNRDSAACSNATFSLIGSAPTGWTGSLSAASINLPAGSSGTVTFTVTAPAGAATASYPISAGTVADASHGAATGSGVFWIDTQPPSTPASLTAATRGTKVTLSWPASSDAGGSGVARYNVRRGTTIIGTPASTTYTDTPGNGPWTYTVQAVDGAGNLSGTSPAATVSVGKK